MAVTKQNSGQALIRLAAVTPGARHSTGKTWGYSQRLLQLIFVGKGGAAPGSAAGEGHGPKSAAALSVPNSPPLVEHLLRGDQA